MVDLETNIEDTANIKEHLDECRFIKNIFTVMYVRAMLILSNQYSPRLLLLLLLLLLG
jgi:predicted anti-sigma-YlaC factor YlaD